jgi:hypothetical protein
MVGIITHDNCRSPVSKIDIIFGNHFHESPLWQKDSLTSPFEKGDQRGISKAVREIPPTPPLHKGGLLYDSGESGRA